MPLVVCCAAFQDTKLQEDFLRHLAPLLQRGNIRVWHKGQILAGENRERICEQRINEASIIVLLLSPNFFNSELCVQTALPAALKRHQRDAVPVVPILIRQVTLDASGLGRLQILPRNRKPIGTSSRPDEIWASVVEELEALLPPQHAASKASRAGGPAINVTPTIGMAGKFSDRSSEALDLLAELEEIPARLADLAKEAGIGWWEWRVATDTVIWSEQLYALYGLKKDEFRASYEGFLSRVHPDDRAYVQDYVSRAYINHQPFSFQHRLLHPSGETRWLRGRGRVRLVDSRVTAMFGTAQDITELKKVEADLSRAGESLRSTEKEKEALHAIVFSAAQGMKNPIGEILQCVSRLRAESSQYETLASLLDTLAQQGQLLARLTNKLLEISNSSLSSTLIDLPEN